VTRCTHVLVILQLSPGVSVCVCVRTCVCIHVHGHSNGRFNGEVAETSNFQIPFTTDNNSSIYYTCAHHCTFKNICVSAASVRMCVHTCMCTCVSLLASVCVCVCVCVGLELRLGTTSGKPLSVRQYVHLLRARTCSRGCKQMGNTQ